MKRLLTICASVSTMLLIISVSVVGVLKCKPIYYFDIDHLDIPAQSGMDPALLKENYSILIDYNSMLSHVPLQFKQLGMSEGGRIHFEEVKDIFVAFQWMLIVMLISSVLLAWVLIGKYKSTAFLGIASVITIVIPAVLGAFIAMNWDRAFVMFHELMFDNDYWLFDPKTDPIITALPDEFFFHCAAFILAAVVLLSVLCGVIRRKTRVNLR